MPALAESSKTLILTATVEGLDPIVLSAPASGPAGPPSACGRDSFSPGETVFTVEPQRACPKSTVRWRMCTHRPAEIGDAAVARLRAVMASNMPTAIRSEASTRTGYNTAENRDLRSGHAGLPALGQ